MTEPTTAPLDAVQDRYAKAESARYANRVSSIASQLRKLADTVEREGDPARTLCRMNSDGLPSHSYAAEQVASEIFWGLANLTLGTLLEAARSADNASRSRVE